MKIIVQHSIVCLRRTIIEKSIYPKVQTEFSGVKTIPWAYLSNRPDRYVAFSAPLFGATQICRVAHPASAPEASPCQTSSQGKNLDSGNASGTQSFAAFVYRTSGGKNIVDQQNPPPRNFGRISKSKDILQVAPPLFPGEKRLGNGRTTTEQQTRLDSVLPLRETTPGNDQGLIKTSFAQTVQVQWNRYNEVRFAKQRQESRLGGDRCQGGDAGQPTAEFQRTDNGGDRWLVMEQGTGKIKKIVAAKAVATQMINACWKRNAATLAARGSNKIKTGEAIGAEQRGPGRFQSALTAQTQGGEQQIL